MNQDRVADLIHQLLIELGEDPDREGLQNTPRRVAKAWEFLTRGQRTQLSEVIGEAKFSAPGKDMIIVRNIEIYSLCEHHMLPFYGQCHVGYIPRDKVLGVSKIARIADLYARRLQIQERLTHEIAGAVMESIDALGVGVVIQAKHLCMMMRGVEKQDSSLVTSSVMGIFRQDPKTREEFMNLIKG